MFSILWTKCSRSKRQVDVICHCFSFLGQLWMLNDTTLKNKANIWQSNDDWKLETIDQSIYIENMSNHTVLGIEKTDTVIAEDFDQYKFGEAWIKGEPDNEGFFTLTNMKSRKLLTAISAQILKVMGKFLTSLISSLKKQNLIFSNFHIFLQMRLMTTTRF